MAATGSKSLILFGFFLVGLIEPDSWNVIDSADVAPVPRVGQKLCQTASEQCGWSGRRSGMNLRFDSPSHFHQVAVAHLVQLQLTLDGWPHQPWLRVELVIGTYSVHPGIFLGRPGRLLLVYGADELPVVLEDPVLWGRNECLLFSLRFWLDLREVFLPNLVERGCGFWRSRTRSELLRSRPSCGPGRRGTILPASGRSSCRPPLHPEGIAANINYRSINIRPGENAPGFRVPR